MTLTTLLTGPWRFHLLPDGSPVILEDAAPFCTAPAFDDSVWQTVTIPHTWNTNPDYPAEGIAWYRCTFSFDPAQPAGAITRLRFAAVFYLAHVWLNGHYLGQHEGGYTPFEFELSGLLQPGPNVLALQVDNRRVLDRLPAHLYEGRSFGWRNDGGIVREVSLLTTGRVYMVSQRIAAAPRLSGFNQADSAHLTLTVCLRNASAQPFTGSLTAQVTACIATHTHPEPCPPVSLSPLSSITLQPGQTTSFTLEGELPNPLLWHFDAPYLYALTTRLAESAGEEMHQETLNFGVRQIDLADAHFILNGEPVRLVGLSRHADTPEYGLAEPEEVMADDFKDLKLLNMVFGRPVHYPQHEFIYDYCDRYGILLAPELPAWQLTAGQMSDPRLIALAKTQLREMIAAAANHPCIWAWSVGNELESDTVAGRAFVRELIAYVKELDPTRPVGFASYHLLSRPWADATQHADFVMMNEYFGSWHGPKDALPLALDAVHQTWPGRPVIISEFGLMSNWQKIEGPLEPDPMQYYLANDRNADLQRQCLISDQMVAFRRKSYLSAAIFWAYRGPMGVVDWDPALKCQYRRDSWEAIRKEFSPILIKAIRAKAGKVEVDLRARGPVEAEIPAYTLRNYRLDWKSLGADETLLAQGDIPLPDLFPGAFTTLKWDLPASSAGLPKVLQVTIFRPTGFPVIERWLDLDFSPDDYDGYVYTESASANNPQWMPDF